MVIEITHLNVSQYYVVCMMDLEGFDDGCRFCSSYVDVMLWLLQVLSELAEFQR